MSVWLAKQDCIANSNRIMERVSILQCSEVDYYIGILLYFKNRMEVEKCGRHKDP